MNYLILNGVKSNTIKGLLIQSLPSISKPLMRTEVEEIDGRDGDIITKLGYSAYDKEVSVGMFGDYNVDDVIQYFDSEGIVTFSNEPDKFYKYQIIQQIDFERLIRFRTATVTFHVQPFKYSAVDNNFTYDNEYLSVNNFSLTKNGVTLTASNGNITVKGTALVATEFYVPVNVSTLGVGSYTLSATATGTSAEQSAIRLINDSPSNANSFGGKPVYLKSNGTVTSNASLTASKTYNYLWFYILPNVAINITVNVSLRNDNFSNVTIRNIGNTISRPVITLYGSSTVTLSVNGMQLFIIDFGSADYITIDATEMNAYYEGNLMNRNVTGDYDNLILKIGTNTISWTGNVTGIEIENFSRWI